MSKEALMDFLEKDLIAGYVYSYTYICVIKKNEGRLK